MKKKILFITATRIGDAILSNGILNHVLTKHPDCALTIACGTLVQSFYEGIPQLEQLIPLKKQSWKRHWIKLWREIYTTQWDIVIDLRNSAVSRLILSKEKYIFGKNIDATAHKSIQNAQILGLETPPPTRLWLTQEQRQKAQTLLPEGAPILGIGPTANWIGKTWPIENFIALTARLLDDKRLFKGWRVAVFAAPGEEDSARKLLETIPSHVGLDLIAKGNPAEAAACLERCNFYIGNDSGLMHAAAATGIPTLGLFGASYASIYAPFGARAAFVHTPETYDELTNFVGYNPKTLDHSLLNSLSVDAVFDAVLSLYIQKNP